MSKSKARIIAFYLPQFHPTDINDKYWGKGFTEWTNVAKAKPLYKGHYQPQIPADLGFYDLRLPEVRQAQADLARDAGIEGFMYWNYWFGGGEKILERPIEEVVKTHKPDYPFCIGWANHDWSNKTWTKSSSFQSDTVFLKQKYLGESDYTDYFNYLLPMFLDDRYIRIDNRPLFYIYDPESIPDAKEFISLWNKLAVMNGLDGIFFVGRLDPVARLHLVNNKDYLNVGKERYDNLIGMGFDAVNSSSFKRAEILSEGIFNKICRKAKAKILGYALNDYDYLSITNNYYMAEDKLDYVYPQLTPRKDKTPRAGKNALIYRDSTPEKFRVACDLALKCVQGKKYEHRVIFLNSWNEWGEGSYMEPDIKFGHGYLDVLREEFT